MITVVITTDEGEVKAAYDGGTYIHVGEDYQNPRDIINVFDYDAGVVGIEQTPAAVEQRLREWLAEFMPTAKIETIAHTRSEGGE